METAITMHVAVLQKSTTKNDALELLQSAVREAGELSTEVASVLDRARQTLTAQREWDVVVALIDLELAHTNNAERKFSLYALRGRLQDEELFEQSDAIESYERALKIRPEDRTTQEALERTRNIRDNWRQVVRKYTEEAQNATDGTLSASLLLWAAEVTWRNDPGAVETEQYLRRSLEISPESIKTRLRLERLLRISGKVDAYAELLAERVEIATDPKERLQACVEAGRFWATRKENEDLPSSAAQRETWRVNSRRWFESALAIDPAEPVSVEIMIGMLRSDEQWDVYAQLLENAIAANPDAFENEAWLSDLGDVYASRLDLPNDAARVYELLRAKAPTDPTMLAFLSQYYARTQASEDKRLLLESAYDAESDSERRCTMAVEIATLCETDLEDVEKAIDAWKRVLQVCRKEQSAEGGALAEFSAAFKALRRLYRVATPPKWNALRELLRDQIDTMGDEQVDQKIELLLETAEIYQEHLKLDVMVIATYNAILALRPNYAHAMDALVENCERLGRWAEMAQMLRRRSDIETDPKKRVALLQRAADVWIMKLNNPGEAVAPLLDILGVDPAHAEATSSLREICQQRGDWNVLFQTIETQSRVVEGIERLRLRVELARLAYERLGELEKAAELWMEVLEESGKDTPTRLSIEAREALATIYKRIERWPALADIYRAQIEATEDVERRVEILRRLAELYSGRLDVSDEAIAAWKEVLSLQPTDAKAFVVLKELLVRQQRWDELESLLAQSDAYGDLVDAFVAAADRSRDADVKVELYQRVGALCVSRLQDVDRAIKAYERVLAVDDGHVPTLTALTPLYEQTERWSRLVGTYEALLERVTDVEQQLGLLSQIRDVCEIRLGSRYLAFQWCARAYRMAPDNRRVIDDLERLAHAAGSWEDLSELYVERLGQLDKSEQVPVLRRLATIAADRLQDRDRAESFLRRIIDWDSNDTTAYESLVDLLRNAGQWDRLVALFEQRAASLLDDDPMRFVALREIARVQEERLADLEAAARTYEAIAEMATGEVLADAAAALERLHRVRGDWAKAAGAIEFALRAEHDDAQRLPLLKRLAALQLERLSLPEAAVETLKAAFSIDPNDREVVRKLESRLDVDDARQPEIAELLLERFATEHNSQAEAKALEVLRAQETDPQKRCVILSRLRDLYSAELNDAARAFDAAAKVLELDPSNEEALAKLLVLGELTGDIANATRSMTIAAEAIEERDAGAAMRLHWELARIFETELSQPEAAESHARRVIGTDPTRADAFELLERVLREQAKWSGLRDVLQARRGLADTFEQKQDILTRIAALSEDVLGDEASAIGAYEEMFENGVTDASVVRALERLYRSSEMWSELETLYATQSVTAAGVDRIDIQTRLAELRVGPLNKSEDAATLLHEIVVSGGVSERVLTLLETLHQRQPYPLVVLDALEQVYRSREQWEQLVGVLQDRCGFTEDSATQVRLLTEIATLQEERLGDLTGALDSWRAVLRRDFLSDVACQTIARLVAVLQCWELGVEIWGELYGALDPNAVQQKMRALQHLAEIENDHLGRFDRAAAHLEALYELDGGTGEAARAAVVTLADIYRGQQRWDEYIGAARRQLAWDAEPLQREALLLAIAETQRQHLASPEQAASTYEELLKIDPTSEQALSSLERIYETQNRWTDLIGLLGKRLIHTTEDNERLVLRRRVATLRQRAEMSTDLVVGAFWALLEEFPGDRDALYELSRIYRAGEQWPDLAGVIETLIEECQDDEERLKLTGQLSELRHRHLADPSGALTGYAYVLQRDSERQDVVAALNELLEQSAYCVEAAQILHAHYERLQAWSELANVHEREVRFADEPRRLSLYVKLAGLYDERLDDASRALDALCKALPLAQNWDVAASILSAAKTKAKREEQWRAVVDALNPHIETERGSDRSLRIEACRSAAEICRAQLRDPHSAMHYYERLLQVAPEQHLTVTELLESLYRETATWGRLVPLLASRAEQTLEPEQRSEALLEAALIADERLGDYATAIAYYEQLRSAMPRHEVVLRALERLYEKTSRWQDLATLLRARVDTIDVEHEKAEYLWRFAHVLKEQLGQEAEALRLYPQMLELVPGDERVVGAIEGFLDGDLGIEAAGILEPIYLLQKNWKMLVRIHEIRLKHTEDTSARREEMLAIAQLHEEQLRDPEAAFQWYEKVLTCDGTDVLAREQLLRLAARIDGWGRVTKLLSAHLDASTELCDADRDVALALETIYTDHLFHWQSARACLDRVLSARPNDAEAFERLERLLVRYERWSELLQAYEQVLTRMGDPLEQRGVLLKMARLCEIELKDHSRAADLYLRVQKVSDVDQDAVAGLERIYVQDDRWKELVELLRAQLSVLNNDDERNAVKRRIAGIAEKRLGDTSMALDYYREALQTNPADAEAIAAVERFLTDPAHRLRATHVLEPVYRENDAWAKLIVVYQTQLEAQEDVVQRIQLYRRIADLHETRGNALERAFKTMCDAFESVPKAAFDAGVMGELERLAEASGQWANLVSLLEHVVARASINAPSSDVDVRALRERVARIYEQRLNDDKAAVRTWRAVLQETPDHEKAIVSLIRLLSRLGSNEELVDAHFMRAENTAAEEVKVESYRSVAMLCAHKLGDLGRAIDAWQQVLAHAPDDEEAVNGLVELLRQEERWPEYISAIQRKVDLTDENKQWREFQLDIANVYQEKLNDNFAAITVLKTVLERFPEDVAVFEQLERMYTKEVLWSELLEIVDLRASIETSEECKNELLCRAGQVLIEGIGDIGAAIDRFEQVLEKDPINAVAQESLEGLLEDPVHRERVANVLELSYKQHHDAAALIRVLETRLDGLTDTEQRYEQYGRIAALWEYDLHNPERAFDMYARALSDDPTNDDIFRELQRLAKTLNFSEKLIAIMSEQLEQVLDSDMRRALHLKVAHMWEAQPSGRENAEKHYREAVDLGADEGAWRALEAILEAEGRDAELLETLERHQSILTDNAEQAELCCRMAGVYARDPDSRDAAFVAYRTALEKHAEHAGALAGVRSFLDDDAYRIAAMDVLERIYDATERQDDLIALWNMRVQTANDAETKQSWLAKKAVFLEERAGDAEKALDVWGEALDVGPSNAEVLDHFARLAVHTGNFSRPVDVLEQLVQRTDINAKTRGVLAIKAGEWLLEPLRQRDRAERLCRIVLEHIPAFRPALQILERIFREDGRTHAHAEVIGQLAQSETNPKRKSELLVDLAVLRESALGDKQGALDVWREILDSGEKTVDALRELERLYSDLEQWDAYVDVLERRRATETGAEQIKVLHRIAEVYAQHLNNEQRAYEMYREILDRNRHDETALVALERVHRQRKDWVTVKAILTERLGNRESVETVPLLRELARVCEERLGKRDEAVSYYEQVRLSAPDDDDVSRQLERLYGATNQWKKLVSLLTERLDRLNEQSDATELRVLRRSIAKVRADKLGDADGAIAALEQMVADDPNDLDTSVALLSLYFSEKRFDACDEVLSRLETLPLDNHKQALVLYWRAKVREGQGGSDTDVLDLYSRAVSVDSGCIDAVIALENLARSRQDWATVAQMLEIQSNEAVDEKRQDVLMQLGVVYGSKLQRFESAIAALQKAQELAPEDMRVVEALAQAYFDGGKIEQAEPLLLQLTAEEPARRRKDFARYFHLLGRIAEERNDIKGALEKYEQARRADSAFGPALVATGRVLVLLEQWEEARKTYWSMLLQNPTESWGITKGNIFAQLARVHLAMGDREKAKSMYERGLEAEPDNDDLKRGLASLTE